jgi:transposase-like protein
MPSRRRHLTPAERREIVRDRAAGVPGRELAARLGVTVRTIELTVRRAREAAEERPPVGTGEAGAPEAGSAGRAAPSSAATVGGADGPSCVVAVRVSRGELRAFEAAIRGAGLTRSEGMKRLMRAASGFFDARDEAEAETLRSLGAALARAGSNANQIARACNAAQARGERLPWATGWPGEVAELGAAAFGIAREVRALADGRRGREGAALLAALAGPVGGDGAAGGSSEPSRGPGAAGSDGPAGGSGAPASRRGGRRGAR